MRKSEYKRSGAPFLFFSHLTSLSPFSPHPHTKSHTSQWPPSKVTTTTLSHPFLALFDTSVLFCQLEHAHRLSFLSLTINYTTAMSRPQFFRVDRKILLLGSGFVAEPCVEYLCRRPENKLTIGNVSFPFIMERSDWRMSEGECRTMNEKKTDNLNIESCLWWRIRGR